MSRPRRHACRAREGLSRSQLMAWLAWKVMDRTSGDDDVAKLKGFIALHRGLTAHWLAKDKPYNHLSAWVWMLLEASWRDRRRLVDGVVVDVPRGSFIASVRFMAEAWGWSRHRVVD